MFAQPGDRIVVHGRHQGDAERKGQVTAVQHADGSPPYVVRWEDSGHESLFFPGPDAAVDHAGQQPPPAPTA